jgi:hypothetical protein
MITTYSTRIAEFTSERISALYFSKITISTKSSTVLAGYATYICYYLHNIYFLNIKKNKYFLLPGMHRKIVKQ